MIIFFYSNDKVWRGQFDAGKDKRLYLPNRCLSSSERLFVLWGRRLFIYILGFKWKPKIYFTILLITAKVTTDYIYYTDGKYIEIQRNNGK